MTDRWRTVVAEPNELGESPFWHPAEQRLYWVDLEAKLILRTQPGSGLVERWAVPQEPGCIAPAARGGLVVALRDGVYRAHEWGGALTRIATFDYDPATTRFNDGKCDPLGRFWAGTIFEPRSANEAKLYSVDGRGGRAPEVKLQAGDAITANGLAWSPRGDTVYWSDTPHHVIHAWDWAADTNTLTRHRVFQQFAGKPAGWTPGLPDNGGYGGRPDGATVDAEGNYYAAMFEGRRVCKFAPDGRLLAEIETPAQCPTMPCLGGPELRTLYLTTARHKRPAAELAALPGSGCVFAMDVDVPGLPVNFFQD
ncbi:gluconolactonase [Rhodoferax koreense]|uniref:Gluconolactonase n=1 Tax=Rhodoferax koreensis TaxID=1842727 RepID=A0A1P8JQC7_9BURK|nr:SMP-30/gluconolactonase/LRE family protein [Rhodoferax koreense]APW35950.1 gluconolactonase [Rhodoferax koreense]